MVGTNRANSLQNTCTMRPCIIAEKAITESPQLVEDEQIFAHCDKLFQIIVYYKNLQHNHDIVIHNDIFENFYAGFCLSKIQWSLGV